MNEHLNNELKKDLSKGAVYLVKMWIENLSIHDIAKGTGVAITRQDAVTDDTVKDIQNELASTFRKIIYQKERDVVQYQIEMSAWNASVNMLWLSRIIWTETRDALFLLPLCTNFNNAPFEMFHDDVCEIIKMFIY